MKVENPSDLISNTAGLAAFRMLAKFFSAVLTFYLARKLGVERYGIYGSILALVGIIGVFQGLGSLLIIFRDISRDPDSARSRFGVALVTYVGSSAVLFGVLLITSRLLGYDASRMRLIAIAALTFLTFSPALACQAVLMGTGRFILQAFISSFGTFINVILCIILLQMGMSLAGVFWSLTLSYGIVSFLMMTTTIRKVGRPDFANLRANLNSVLPQSLPLLMTSIVVEVIFRADRTLIDRLMGAHAVGIYQAAYNVFYLPREGFLIPFASAVSAKIFDYHHNNKKAFFELFDHSNFTLLAVSLPIVIYTAFFAEPMIRLLYGEKFLLAAQILPILIVTVPFIFLVAIWQPVLLAENRTVFVFVTNAIAMATYLVLNYYLIQIWGLKASAAVSVLAQAMILAILMIGVGKRSYFRFGSRMPKLIAINGGLIGALLVLTHVLGVGLLPTIFSTTLTGLLYVASLYLSGVMTVEEKLWLNQQIKLSVRSLMNWRSLIQGS